MEVIAKTLKDYRDLKVARMEVSQCLGFMQLDAKSPSRAWQLLLQRNLFFSMLQYFLGSGDLIYKGNTLDTT
jgi:hypothetical protein